MNDYIEYIGISHDKLLAINTKTEECQINQLKGNTWIIGKWEPLEYHMSVDPAAKNVDIKVQV